MASVDKRANGKWLARWREYPGGPVYAPTTGFSSIVYGRTGIEAAHNEVLAGTADSLFYSRVGQVLTGQGKKITVVGAQEQGRQSPRGIVGTGPKTLAGERKGGIYGVALREVTVKVA